MSLPPIVQENAWNYYFIFLDGLICCPLIVWQIAEFLTCYILIFSYVISSPTTACKMYTPCFHPEMSTVHRLVS